MIRLFGLVYVALCLIVTGVVLYKEYKEYKEIIEGLKNVELRKTTLIKLLLSTLCIPFIPAILTYLWLDKEYDN